MKKALLILSLILSSLLGISQDAKQTINLGKLSFSNYFLQKDGGLAILSEDENMNFAVHYVSPDLSKVQSFKLPQYIGGSGKQGLITEAGLDYIYIVDVDNTASHPFTSYIILQLNKSTGEIKTQKIEGKDKDYFSGAFLGCHVDQNNLYFFTNHKRGFLNTVSEDASHIVEFQTISHKDLSVKSKTITLPKPAGNLGPKYDWDQWAIASFEKDMIYFFNKGIYFNKQEGQNLIYQFVAVDIQGNKLKEFELKPVLDAGTVFLGAENPHVNQLTPMYYDSYARVASNGTTTAIGKIGSWGDFIFKPSSNEIYFFGLTGDYDWKYRGFLMEKMDLTGSLIWKTNAPFSETFVENSGINSYVNLTNKLVVVRPGQLKNIVQFSPNALDKNYIFSIESYGPASDKSNKRTHFLQFNQRGEQVKFPDDHFLAKLDKELKSLVKEETVGTKLFGLNGNTFISSGGGSADILTLPVSQYGPRSILKTEDQIILLEFTKAGKDKVVNIYKFSEKK
jgi:hypothetical protein